jgi:hypothetical protein
MWANAQDPGSTIEKDPAKPPGNEESSVSLTAPEPRSIVGTIVQTPQGEKLGTVEEVLVDEAGGREFYVLKIGEDRFAAIPKAAVSVMMRDKVLMPAQACATVRARPASSAAERNAARLSRPKNQSMAS